MQSILLQGIKQISEGKVKTECTCKPGWKELTKIFTWTEVSTLKQMSRAESYWLATSTSLSWVVPQSYRIDASTFIADSCYNNNAQFK